jgi:hypothetical protein
VATSAIALSHLLAFLITLNRICSALTDAKITKAA